MKSDRKITVLLPIGLPSGATDPEAPDSAAIMLARRLEISGNKPEIIAVGVGGPCAEEGLLAALASGADRGVKVDTDRADPMALATLLANLARREQPNIVLLGDREVEDPSSQIGPRLAALLNWPYVSCAHEIELSNDEKRCQALREIDGSRERLELTLPAVVSVSVSVSNIPLLSLYEIVAARSKTISRVRESQFGPLPPTGFSVLRSEPETIERKGRIVGSVDELITALREEAHVI